MFVYSVVETGFPILHLIMKMNDIFRKWSLFLGPFKIFALWLSWWWSVCLFNSLIVCVLFSVQHSLAVLMEKMFVAGPHFVRCIKPNRSKQPDQLDSKLVMDQVGSAESLQHLQRSSAAFSPVWASFIFHSGAKCVLSFSCPPVESELCELNLNLEAF